ncbi:HpcH/HpaI aldolase/citrate lyase family protein [Halopelagius longus]|uniref:Citrate lyase subunit beta / citryl-CoA lyase n=1 Tax=Halopelagius longus TaxID=1236180 RepID=A0A1H1AU43_9EURY|nr:CoA ester lyase [Halopelagius longus]RDI70517.1 CoA ester lyase [Halopelagius longus]SDQ43197.1 citrate lyase subunit beta / citryl-CoA lyase [Halopelagius longus]
MARRSLLFSPGDRKKLLRNAPATDADIVCFDLEDAVAPARKEEAREAVRAVLADPSFDPDAEVVVRVSDAFESDFDALFGSDGADSASDANADSDLRLDAVMVPKVDAAGDVRAVADELAARGRTLPVFALVENARGALNAPEIADAEATTALVFGAEDLAADIGATRTAEGTEVLYARERVVLAAAAAGVDAIDTVYTDFEDEAGLREATEFAATLGYDGKMAIHPAQVGPINEAFTPAPDRVEWAKRVLEARDDADEEGRGVFRVDGEMIDAPLVAQAERILDRAGYDTV